MRKFLNNLTGIWQKKALRIEKRFRFVISAIILSLLMLVSTIFLTLSFYLFYFLFPVRWLTRLPFIVLYGISIYAVLLCSNIFNVGVEKSIQLYRAAFSINFFYQAVVFFLFNNALFSFKLHFIFNSLLVFLTAFLLGFQFIWTVKLDLRVEKKT